jgi:hypothetical protein
VGVVRDLIANQRFDMGVGEGCGDHEVAIFREAGDGEVGLDGAEAWYDYTMAPRWSPTPVVCEAIARNLSDRGLLHSCGTDSHGLTLRGR